MANNRVASTQSLFVLFFILWMEKNNHIFYETNILLVFFFP